MTIQKKSGSQNHTPDWSSFRTKTNRFLQKTEENAMQGINPGGYYYAVWCRDASYILKDWFLSGHIHEVLNHIYHIWSHQIGSKVTVGKTNEPNEKVVYGRGSPQAKFRATTLADKQRELLYGALPTTIYQAGYSEIYGENPDIDSTALMVSTTSWIMSHVLEKYRSDKQGNRDSKIISKASTIKVTSHRAGSSDETKDQANLLEAPLLLANHLSSKMARAIQYLSTRDVDKDGLLEQGPNEDWMDTALRNGKIVYSQAAWILALKNFAALLSKIQTMPAPDNKNAYFDDRSLQKDNDLDSNSYGNTITVQDVSRLADNAIQSVEKILWSDEENCYIDIHEKGHRLGKAYHLLTQDVVLYLVAITENSGNDSLRVPGNDGNASWNNYQDTALKRADEGKNSNSAEKIERYNKKMHERSLSTLGAIKKRTWRGKWPLITEALLDVTGPWVLKPFQYHNHTFWPWTTGIEMLARSRFGMIDDCNLLLSTLASEGHPHIHAYYEWVNPLNDKGNGAFPFRTGISEVRIALTDILASTQNDEITH